MQDRERKHQSSPHCRRRRRSFRRRIIFLFTLSFSLNAEVTLDPYISVEAAKFTHDGAPLTQDQVLSAIPGFNFSYEQALWRYQAKHAYRVDTFDKKRDFFSTEENFLEKNSPDSTYSFRLGMQRVSLGSLEILQSIDSVNEMVTDSMNPKINRQGYPVFSFRYYAEKFKAEFFHFPYFYAPFYPANSARLGIGVEYDVEEAITTSSEKKGDGFILDQFGFKFDFPFETFDIAFGHFHFVDRSVSLTTLDINNRLTRYFYSTDFTFFNFQASVQDYLIKGNLFRKDYHGRTVEARDLINGTLQKRGLEEHYVVALGFESKLLWTNPIDTTFFLEGQKMLGVNRTLARRYNVFSEDMAYGLRLALNDILNKQLIIGHIIDLHELSEQLFQIDYKQNLTDKIGFNLGLRIIEARAEGGNFNFDSLAGLYIVDDADSIYTNLTYTY